MAYPVITIDGPSGAGKGTVCTMLAQALGYRLLDSGALYRIVGLKAWQAGLLESALESGNMSEQTKKCVTTLTNSLEIEFVPDEKNVVRVVVNGDDVSNDIRSETVGKYASVIAAVPQVRESLLSLQRDMACQSGLVADGRDMGTVVFPDADAKVYLTASAQARAERRVAQLVAMNKSADYQDILTSIQSRDERDENRVVSPSKPAEDALVLDSSNLDTVAVFEQIKQFCQKKGICF